MIADTITPESPSVSSTANERPIQSNESELISVNSRLRNANRIYLVCGALTLWFTAITLAASFFIYRYSNDKGVLEQRISEQKDRDFDTYKLRVASQVAEASKEGIEAGKTAGDSYA
jgi:hypothetical protein